MKIKSKTESKIKSMLVINKLNSYEDEKIKILGWVGNKKLQSRLINNSPNKKHFTKIKIRYKNAFCLHNYQSFYITNKLSINLTKY